MGRPRPFGRKRATVVVCAQCSCDIDVTARYVRGMCGFCYRAWWRANQVGYSVHNPTGGCRLPGRAEATKAAKNGWVTRKTGGHDGTAEGK